MMASGAAACQVELSDISCAVVKHGVLASSLRCMEDLAAHSGYRGWWRELECGDGF